MKNARKCLLGAAALVISLVSSLTYANECLPNVQGDTTLFRNAKVLKSGNDAGFERRSIYVNSGKIVGNTDSACTHIQPTAIVDAANKFMIPPLFDSNQYVFGDQLTPVDSFGEGYDAPGTRVLLQRSLAAGIFGVALTNTSHVDFPDFGLENIFPIKAEAEAGVFKSPSIYTGGGIFTSPGVLNFGSPVEIGADVALATQTTNTHLQTFNPNLINLIHRNERNQAISLGSLAAVITAAHARQVKVAAVIETWRDALEALDAGADMLIHVPINGQDANNARNKATVLRKLARGNIPVVSTVLGYYFLGELYRDVALRTEFVTSPLLNAVAARSAISVFSTPEKWTPDLVNASLADLQSDEKMTNLKDLFDRGVLVLAGGSASFEGLFFGHSLHAEIELWQRHGMINTRAKRLRALRAASVLPQQFFTGVSRQPFKVNSPANFLLLDESPLEDIRNTQKIHKIVKAGEEIDRATLDLAL